MASRARKQIAAKVQKPSTYAAAASVIASMAAFFPQYSIPIGALATVIGSIGLFKPVDPTPPAVANREAS